MEINGNTNLVIKGKLKSGYYVEVQQLKGIRKRHPMWKGARECVDLEGKPFIICNYPDCAILFTHPCSTTVLHDHYASLKSHSEQLKVYDEETEMSRSQPTTPKNKRTRTEMEAVGNRSSQLVLQICYHPESARAKEIRRKIGNALANPSVSINSWLKDSLQDLVHTLDNKYKLPTSFTGLKNILFARYEEIHQQVVKLTSVYTYSPSLTIDIWSDSSSSYLGVTYHCLKPDGALSRLFLGIAEVEGSKTATKVRRITEEMLHSFKIRLQDCFRIVTDNGSNMVAAFPEIDYKTTPFPDDEEDDEEDNAISTTAESTTAVLSDLCVDFPHRLPCFAHRANTAMEKGLVDLMASDAFKMMAKIITSVRQSPQALGLLRKNTSKGLISPSSTRWAYWPEVIGRFLEQYVAIVEADRVLEKRWNLLETSHLNYLVDALQLLKPFVEVLTRIQAEQSVTISMAYPFVQALLLSVRSAKSLGPLSTQSLATSLEYELDRVFTHILHPKSVNYDPIYLMATSLDPNYAKLLEDKDIDNACVAIASLLPVDDNSSSAEIESQPAGHLSSLLDTLSSRRRCVTPPLNANVKECLHYIQALDYSPEKPVDPIKWWMKMLESKWAKIAILALSVLNVPASSSPIERVFSWAGMASSKLRNRVKRKTLNAQLFIDLNQKNIGQT